MRITVQKLRTGIVVLFLLLVVGIVSFLAYARWRLRRFARDLPGKLGVEIQQSTNDFTFSKTQAGKTLFTIHASKAVQLKAGGKALLHDVSITLYNRSDGSADHISGSEFEYDQKAGEARASGTVHIDLHTPAAVPGGGAAPSVQPLPVVHTEDDRNFIHILTSNLVFNQKTGMASTPSYIEFHFPQASGSAVGATYNSGDGTLVLDHEVSIDSLPVATGGAGSRVPAHPVALRAASARLDRRSSQAVLERVRYASQDQQGSADTATAFLRTDGSPDHLEAAGSVIFSSGTGSRISAPRAVARFTDRSLVQRIDLSGGVTLLSTQPAARPNLPAPVAAGAANRRIDGHSATAQIDFDAAGQARHATLDQGVTLAEAASGGGATATRHLNSEHMDIEFAPVASGGTPMAGQVELRTVVATGGAMADLQSKVPGNAPQHSTISADRIESAFGSGGNAEGNRLTRVHGIGHTRLTDLGANGTMQTSTGEDLVLSFADASARSGPGSTLESAMQQGHVVFTQTPAQGQANHSESAETPSRAGVSTATADRIEYSSATGMVVLTGSPRLKDDALALNAQQIELNRSSGDAVARGSVQATYLSTNTAAPPSRSVGAGAQMAGSGAVAGGGQPVHAIGDQADFHRSAQVAVFRGHARLWQGSSTIEAPVIELSRARQTIQAHAANAVASNATAPPVHAVFLDPAPAAAPAPSEGAGGRQAGPAVIQVSSQSLLYSDAERLATFTGSVETHSDAALVFADMAQVYLMAAGQKPGQPAGSAAASLGVRAAAGPATVPALGSGVLDHIVATGHIRIEQPERRATAERLVYTASDGRFVLTGTANAVPRVVDREKGTVTGDTLTFFSREDTVRVSGNGARTTTETRVKH